MTNDEMLKIDSAKQKRKLHTSTFTILTLAVITTAFALMLVYSKSWSVYQNRFEEAANTELFKTLNLQTIDGGRFTSEDLQKSDLTVINIWGITCPSCIQELPALESVSNSYDKKDVQIAGLLTDVSEAGLTVNEESLDKAKQIVDQCGVTFPNLIMDVEAYRFGRAYLVGTPTTLFLNKKGDIVESVTGAMGEEEWKETIDKVLSKVNND